MLTAGLRKCRHGKLSVDFMDNHDSEDIEVIFCGAR